MSGIRYTDVATPGAAPKANSIQHLLSSGYTGGSTPEGGTVRLKFQGYETPALAYNTAAATVGYFLGQLRSIGTENVTVTGGTLQNTVAVEFIAHLGNLNVPSIEITDNLLTAGGTYGPTIDATHAQPGVTALGRGLSKGTVVVSRATGVPWVQTGDPLNPVFVEVVLGS